MINDPSLSLIQQCLTCPNSAKDTWNALSELAELVSPESRSRPEFIEECKSGKLDGVVAAYRTFGSFDITGMFDQEMLSVLPKTWRFLAHNGECFLVPLTTQRTIACKRGLYCTEAGIWLSNNETDMAS